MMASTRQHSLTKNPDFLFRNWAQMFAMSFSRPHSHDTWLSFAIEGGLARYTIAEITPDSTVVKLKMGRPLFHYALHGQRPLDRSKDPLWRDLDVTKYLLDHSSDHNELSDGLIAYQVLLSDASCGEEHEGGRVPYKTVDEALPTYTRQWWQVMCAMCDRGEDIDFIDQKSISIPAAVGIPPSQKLFYRGVAFGADVYSLTLARLGPIEKEETDRLLSLVTSRNLEVSPIGRTKFNLFLANTTLAGASAAILKRRICRFHLCENR